MLHAILFVMPRLLLLVLALTVAACDGPGILLGDARVDTTSDPWTPPEATDPCAGYTDSDGDTIPDSLEGFGDWDGDTLPNELDHDSDGDGWSDAEEAGDDDLCTPPVNSDWGWDSRGNPMGDDIPDFLDTDSDNDGLTDAYERAIGTDPRIKDTDRDGYLDLVEETVGTDPTDPWSIPSPDLIVVELHYMGPEHEHWTVWIENTVDYTIDINGLPEDEPLDPPGVEYDSTVFIKDITPIEGYPSPPLGYSHQDETFFYGVEPGTGVSFDIDIYNNTVPPLDTMQLLQAWIVFLGDGEIEIDRHQVIVLVPTEGYHGGP